MRFRFTKVVGVSVSLAGAVAMAMTIASPAALAFGKKKPSTGGGNQVCKPDSGLTTPNPARKVVLGKVGTLPFKLPNGSTVDLSADLNTILSTAVADTQNYFPTDKDTASDPCGTHLEIAASVSTLQLNALQVGVTFGYTPSGATSPTGTNITGNATVKVGTIAMDFSVRQCTQGGCTTVGAATANAATAGVSTSFTVNFGDVTTGPSLVYDTQLGSILRKIMNDGAKKLVAATNPGLLSWSAVVREVVPGAGVFIFDAGTQSLIKPNQSFAVYAVTPATGRCDVYKAVANAHTTQVSPLSSTAVIDEALDSRGVAEGDLVVIREANAKP